MKGRTYRYFDDALFPFGYGLSYTNMEVRSEKLEMSDDGGATLTAEVANTGKWDGTEIVQVYIRNTADAEGPLKTLRGFQRVSVKSGQTAKATIHLSREHFECWDSESNTMRVKPGTYDVLVGNSSLDKDLKKLTISIQ